MNTSLPTSVQTPWNIISLQMWVSLNPWMLLKVILRATETWRIATLKVQFFIIYSDLALPVGVIT